MAALSTKGKCEAGKRIAWAMTDGIVPVTTLADPALEKAPARAFRYQRLLDEGGFQYRRNGHGGED